MDIAKTPLKLFLSYGHEEAEIVRLMDAYLRSRGHEVFFDERGICVGDDWRERIAREASDSDGMVACLSRHALCEGGVCHDELDIAVGVRGGNVITVLLDPEGEVNPPALLSHRQWLDMSSWRERMGSEGFDAWFNGRMKELTAVIESPESVELQGDLTYISQRLGVPVDTSRRAALLSKPYYGRGWLTELVDEWMSDRNTPRVCLLTGGPGAGKSAFAARLSHWDSILIGRVAASVFCVRGRSAFNSPEAVSKAIAYSLACTIPQYRTLLKHEFERGVDVGAMDGESLFSYLVVELLSQQSTGITSACAW